MNPQTDHAFLQTELMNRIVDRWRVITQVSLIWIEGSMCDPDRNACPVSDLDMRLAIDDSAYDALWANDRTYLFQWFEPYRLLEDGFFRGLFPPSIIVEAWAYRSSEVPALNPFNSRILYRGTNFSGFDFPEDSDGTRTLQTEFPAKRTVTASVLQQSLNLLLWNVAQCAPRTYFYSEWASTRIALDFNRLEILKLFYLDRGVNYPNRNRELSRILSAEQLAELNSTYPLDGERLDDPYALWAIWERQVAVWTRQLQRMAVTIQCSLDFSHVQVAMGHVKGELSSGPLPGAHCQQADPADGLTAAADL